MREMLDQPNTDKPSRFVRDYQKYLPAPTPEPELTLKHRPRNKTLAHNNTIVPPIRQFKLLPKRPKPDASVKKLRKNKKPIKLSERKKHLKDLKAKWHGITIMAIEEEQREERKEKRKIKQQGAPLTEKDVIRSATIEEIDEDGEYYPADGEFYVSTSAETAPQEGCSELSEIMAVRMMRTLAEANPLKTYHIFNSWGECCDRN